MGHPARNVTNEIKHIVPISLQQGRTSCLRSYCGVRPLVPVIIAKHAPHPPHKRLSRRAECAADGAATDTEEGLRRLFRLRRRGQIRQPGDPAKTGGRVAAARRIGLHGFGAGQSGEPHHPERFREKDRGPQASDTLREFEAKKLPPKKGAYRGAAACRHSKGLEGLG